MELKAKGLFYGLMGCWTAVEDAAIYHVYLQIKCFGSVPLSQNIAEIDVERNIRYCSFTNLADIGPYSILVEAEDRSGNIIDKCSCTGVNVETLKDIDTKGIKDAINETTKAARGAGRVAVHNW